MKLSDGEKLILLMLSEVFEKLKVEGSIDPVLVKKPFPTITPGH